MCGGKISLIVLINSMLISFLQLIEAKKETFEKEMSQKRNELSKDQADMLLEQHKRELEMLSRSMDVEKQRQMNSLGDKIAERKRRKAAALEQKHQAEMAKTLMNQQSERQKVQDDKVNNEENTNILLLWSQLGENRAALYPSV